MRNFLVKLNVNKKVLSESKFELMIDRLEKESHKFDDKILPFSQVEKLFASRPSVFQQVYNHWVKKRAQQYNPLLRRFTKITDPDDPDPTKAFRERIEDKVPQRKGRRNDQPSLLKMKQLRAEMERVRTLLETIKKREKLKRDKFYLQDQIFDLQCIKVKQSPESMFEDEDDLSPPPPQPPLKKRKIHKKDFRI